MFMFRQSRVLRAVVLGTAFFILSGFRATPLRLGAAADLRDVLPEVLQAFAAVHPEARTEVIYGASGLLANQITEGAPFDVFLSADEDLIAPLVKSGKALAESQVRYAGGILVLVVRSTLLLANDADANAVLHDPKLTTLAIANPRHAPYGRAAADALEHLGLSASLKQKLVYGENVGQAAQFFASGAAQAALLPKSLIAALGVQAHVFAVPESWYKSVNQAAVALSGSKHAELARALTAFLKDPKAQAIFRAHGYHALGEAAPG